MRWPTLISRNIFIVDVSAELFFVCACVCVRARACMRVCVCALLCQIIHTRSQIEKKYCICQNVGQLIHISSLLSFYHHTGSSVMTVDSLHCVELWHHLLVIGGTISSCFIQLSSVLIHFLLCNNFQKGANLWSVLSVMFITAVENISVKSVYTS